MPVLQSFSMAYRRRRTSKKSKRSKKNSVPFAVSLKSPKRKDTAVNSQVQKRLDSLLKKRGKLGQSQQEGGFIGSYSCSYCASVVTLSCKRSKKDTSLKW